MLSTFITNYIACCFMCHLYLQVHRFDLCENVLRHQTFLSEMRKNHWRIRLFNTESDRCFCGERGKCSQIIANKSADSTNIKMKETNREILVSSKVFQMASGKLLLCFSILEYRCVYFVH